MEDTNLTKVPWSAKDAVVVFVLAWIGLPVLLFLLLTQLAEFAPLASSFLELVRSGNLSASFSLLVLDSLAALVLVWYYLMRRGASWRDLGLRKFKVGHALALFLVINLVFIVTIPLLFALVQMLFPAFDASQEQTNEFIRPGAGAQTLRLSFIALVLVPAFVEEIVFRGFIFPGLSTRFGIWGGAIISSLLFGFAHLQFNVSIYTIMLGLLLSFMYWRLKSIWPGIILHMFNNYLAFLAVTSI